MNQKDWERLQRFESRDYIERHYVSRFDHALNAQQASQVRSYFEQGREYFVAASNASSTVKPVLIYYGAASLARGATLLKTRTNEWANLASGHGLSTVEWNETLKTGISSILNLKIRAAKGTFCDFVNAIGNCQSYTWRDEGGRSGGFNIDFGKINFLVDDLKISLGDLLSREHSLATEYEIANDGWGNTDFGYVVALEGMLRILFMPVTKYDLGESIKCYGFPDNIVISNQQMPSILPISMLAVDIPANGELRKRYAPMSASQDGRVGWLIRPFSNADRMIDLHRLFMQSYIFGMLSRYYPHRWMALLRSEKGDIARSVVLSAVNRVETEYPKLIVGQLN